MADKTTKRFKVTIEEIVTVTSTTRGNYTVVREELYSAEEIKRATDHVFDHGQTGEQRDENKDMRKQLDAGTPLPIKKIYDYAPSAETTKEVTVKIYEQITDDLNIQAVITAVNRSED